MKKMKNICVIMVLVLITGNLAGCADRSQPTVSGGKDEISGTIRISTTRSHRYLEEAAQKFESQNPGVKVVIDEYLNPELSVAKSWQNYTNTINTELMSGKGADILFVTGLPYKKYISRRMFADLNQLMKSDPDYDASKYYTNIFDAVEINNGLYTLPVEYVYNLLGSDTDEINANDRLWNWQECFSASQSVLNGGAPGTSGRYILPETAEGLFGSIFSENYNHFINEDKKTSSFNSKEFITLLKQCKSLADKNQLAKSSEQITDEAYEQSLFQYYDISSLSVFALTQEKHFYRLPSEDKGRVDFTLSMYAINNASPNKTAAWEFLKFLISDEMQSSPSIALPVNKSAYKQMCKIETNQFCQDESINLTKDKKIELMQKYASFNDSIVKDFKIYLYVDPHIIDIVYAEIKPFFAGDASAEDVTRIIQNKIDIYLKE